MLLLVLGSRSATSRSASPCRSRRLLPISLALSLLTVTGGAWAQVGLQLEAGLEGKIRAGQWAPVRVTATNSGEPVSGVVELSIAGGRTALPLELPTSANKRLETTLIPHLPYAVFHRGRESATASVRGEGRVVANTQVFVQVLPDTERLLVVCGAVGAGLRFLDGMSLGEAGWSLPLEQQLQLQQFPMTTAHLAAAQMPADGSGLAAADLLVIPDTGWRQMEPRQRQAVRQWVEMGGRLLLCGEDPTGFSDEEGRRLLPVQMTGPRPRAALTGFPLPGRAPITAATGQVMTVAARPLPGAMVALREAGVSLVVTRPAGFGLVLWLGFDPFRIIPGSQAERLALWAFLINHATSAEASQPAFPSLMDVAPVHDGVKRLPRFPAPSRWTLGSFGISYVVIFGPVNLWLLRRLRRTVRAWLLMPALSLSMTGGVLALGNNWGRARIVFHTASVLETMADSGTARELSLAALFSPTNRAFGLAIEGPTPTVRFLSEGEAAEQAFPGGRPSSPAAEGTPATMPDLRDGDLCRWDRIALTLWTMQLIQAERAVNLGGGVRLDLDDRLAGWVRNDTPRPLAAAYLQFHGWRCPVGELAPGAALRVRSAGWRRHLEATAGAGSDGRSPAGVGMPAGSASTGDELLDTGGSRLLGGGEHPEVVLVARVPGWVAPIRMPGVTRSPAPGLAEGALLLVRKSVAATAGALLGQVAGGKPAT